MKRLIPRPRLTVPLMAASLLAGTWLSLSFAQQSTPTFSRVGPPGEGSPNGDVGTGVTRLDSATESGGATARERTVAAVRDLETQKAIQAYRQAQDDDVKSRIAKTLPGLVAQQFDARQDVRERELKQLEEQVGKLREMHQRRAKQRDQIIDERVRQLLRDADGLGWGSENEQPPSISFSSASDPLLPGTSSSGEPLLQSR